VTDDRLVYEVLAVVGEIPAGKVATYGQIARLAGRPKNSRLIGNILKYSDQYGEYPCHRVVNHAGRLAPLFHAQRSLLEAEGVRFDHRGHVRMQDFQWDA
jgi:methylated-DNA-protein-cysteine methyltransferase-like protein